ncbi:hypothetical protein Tco_0320769 [Tanacetum coccineum]
MTGAKFGIEKFIKTGDFRSWRIKMRALLIQHGCEAALDVLPADMEAEAKAELNKKANNEFNKTVLDLANIEVTFEDEDLALLLLTSLPASYEHFVDTLLYKREALTLEDVMATLNLKELKERSKGKRDNGEGLYVRGRTDRRDSHQSKGNSRLKSRGGRLKCYIFQSEDHLKRNCPKNNHKKSIGYVKKDDKPSSSGSIYDGSEVMMVMSAKALLDWIMDSRGSYHRTPRLDIFFDFLECDGVVYCWVTTGSAKSESCAGLTQKTGTYQRDKTTCAGKAGAVWQEESRWNHWEVQTQAVRSIKEWNQLVEIQTRRMIKAED